MSRQTFGSGTARGSPRDPSSRCHFVSSQWRTIQEDALRLQLVESQDAPIPAAHNTEKAQAGGRALYRGRGGRGQDSA